MPAKYSECMAATCTFALIDGKPAGFQKAEVASLTLAACAPPIPSALAPTPIDRNSLLYFGGCALRLKLNTDSKQTVVAFNLIIGCFCKVTRVCKIYCVDFMIFSLYGLNVIILNIKK